MRNQKVTLDSIALAEYPGLITAVSERLSGQNRKSFAKELAVFLRIETITNFMKRNKIVSHIDDLLSVVGDRMMTSGKKFSSAQIGNVKTGLELTQEITGNNAITAKNAEETLLGCGNLPTLGDFLQSAFDAKEGWHLTFIEVEDDGKRKVATVYANWYDGVLGVDWDWFDPERRWRDDISVAS